MVKIANECFIRENQLMHKISKTIIRELSIFCKVAEKSSNLKDTFRKYLCDANTQIFAACSV